MLPISAERAYQLLRPYTFRESEIEADHYLSSGSYSSPFTVPGLKCFSKYLIRAHTHFPIIKDIVEDETVLILVLKGSLKIDGEVIKQDAIAINPKQIGGDEENQAEFIRIVLNGKHQKVEDKDALFATDKVKIYRKNVAENQTLEFKEKSLVNVMSGKCTFSDFKPELFERESVLLRKPMTLAGVAKTTSLLWLIWQ